MYALGGIRETGLGSVDGRYQQFRIKKELG